MWKGGRGGERKNDIDIVFMYIKNKIVIKAFSFAVSTEKCSFLKDKRRDRMKVNILEKAVFPIRE